MPEKAMLGFATTEELFRELIVRFTIHCAPAEITQMLCTERALILAEMLGGLNATEKEYRTVNS